MMKFVIFIYLGLNLQLAFADQISDTMKKNKIIDSLNLLNIEVEPYQIEITPNNLSLNFNFQRSRFFESGEKDIYEISVDFYKQDTPYVIKCDMMSGEVGRVKPIYFLVFADCTEINQENFKERSIILEKQDWSDWKYT